MSLLKGPVAVLNHQARTTRREPPGASRKLASRARFSSAVIQFSRHAGGEKRLARLDFGIPDNGRAARARLFQSEVRIEVLRNQPGQVARDRAPELQPLHLP
jgi:hypothetical protein